VIDLSGLPVPDGAPGPGACVRVERPRDGLAVLHLDPPHRPSLAVFDVPLLRDLDAALEELASDASLKGLVITGREPLSFAAGADVETIAGISEPEPAAKFVGAGQELFQRIHRLGREGGGRVLVVAAVGGPVPGGACELALACDRIVLADDPKTRIGLPEVLLGIYPAWGGSQRLPRRLGVTAALGSILTGRLHRARKALKMGLVDRTTKPAYLVDVASRIALGEERCARRERRGWRKLLLDRNPLAGAVIAWQARKGVLEKTKGHYPAPLAVLPLVVRAPRMPLEKGLVEERERVLPLATSPVAGNLVNIFLGSEEAKKLARDEDGEEAPPIRRAAVLGAGVMGGGIAGLMAEKGISVRLRDLERSQLDAALVEQQTVIGKKRRRRRMEAHAADAALDRLEVTTEAIGFDRCEIVIEAVAERLEVKRAVLGELARLMPAGAILATNTSSLSVDAIAAELPAPERVVGVHFFNPVRRMPLVEIVRGAQTSDEVVRRAAKLAVDLGKTPVVTRDVAGFLVNRLLGPYLDEAVRLVDAGQDPKEIDDALVAFGMPMGPCELIDEVGLDIAAHAGASLEAAYGSRMQASRFLSPLVEAGQLGKKTGAGLYLWRGERGGKQKNVGRNPKLPERGGAALSREDVVDRCVLAMVNEAARALAEEVVAGPAELDLGVVFGTGFAPFRGGVLRYADDRGAQEIVDRLGGLARAEGGERSGRFEAAEMLVALAESGGRFHA
jgi:3-hydroxyacyl-CoA dehydrogenase/enoyl-CoA hydratase/3-hydroxybutyryl-CoA epimerase